MFEAYLRDGSVKRISPDRELAKSLIKVAKLRLERAKKEKPSDENSFFIVENCYEAVREMIDALMTLDGYKSYSHEACIEFLKKFYENEVGLSVIFLIDRNRKLRNDIKYRGILPSMNEGKSSVDEMEAAFAALEKILVKRTVKKI